MNTEKWCGVELFQWENWDEMDTGVLAFYDPIWLLDSMKQYNECPLDININGEMTIFDSEGCETVWSGFVIDIPEVREELKER